MKKLLSIITIMFLCVTSLMAQGELNISGDWTPDGKSYLGEIKIKYVGAKEYKVRLNTPEGVVTLTGTLYGNTIEAEWEDEAPEYGEFWIGNGPIEKGRTKEILVGHEGYSYGTNGAVTGWLGNNQNYYYTNSRGKCATVEKSFCCIKLVFDSKGMTAYWKMKGVYYKNGQPMFYQESGWGDGVIYTQW